MESGIRNIEGAPLPYGWRVEVLASPEAVARRGAERLLDQLRRATWTRPRAHVALAGGSTPKRMYELLAQRDGPFFDSIIWDRVTVFLGDERWVAPDHPDSNEGMARRALFDQLWGDGYDWVRGMYKPGASPEQAAEAYERLLRLELSTVEGVAAPVLDMLFLGMGPDGHTASIFPGSEALRVAQRLVVAPERAEAGHRRVTLAPPMLLAAEEVVVMACGAEKADMLRQVLYEPADIERRPSQLLASRVAPTIWLVDQAAAASL